MSTPTQGEVVTFYSYKGGVGRSAAVANVATLLAQRGKKVLAVDFDVEAPGLHRYFAAGVTARSSDNPGPEPDGTIEFFAAFRSLCERAASSSGADDVCLDERSEAALRDGLGALLDGGAFIRDIAVDDPNRAGDKATLSLMRAGRFDPSYPERVRSFPWQTFYEECPFFAELLADELGKRYDYVLIDSRTGTTDVGNLCTVLLPEKLVVVFTPNEQSLHGAVEVGQQAVELRKASQDVRPLPLFPLMSRVENAENELQRRWMTIARQRFEQVFHTVYGVNKSLSAYFDLIQIPHRSFYAYGETIAATRERSTEVHSLVGAFRVFADALTCNNAIEAQGSIQRRWEAATGAPLEPQRLQPEPSDHPESDRELPTFAASSNAIPAASATPPLRGIVWGIALSMLASAIVWVGFAAIGMRSEARPVEASTSIEESTLSVPSPFASTTPPSPAPESPTPQVEATAFGAVPSSSGSRPIAQVVGIRAARPTPTARPSLVPASVPPPALPPSADQGLLGTLKIRASSVARRGEVNSSGKQVFDFRVWLEAPAEAAERIQAVDYFFDHPSFAINHFASSQGPSFSQGYLGWGCISNVQITVTWKSGTRSTLPFDQCAAL
jgi:cellulose biosynthesis protein BcsQ